VEVVLPPGIRWNPGPGVRTRRARPGQELGRRGLWLCASRIDTATDQVGRGDPDEAVVMLDRLCVRGMVRLADVQDAVAALPACRGSAQASAVAARADGLAGSPQETRLRLLFTREGLPAPVAQFRVFGDDGFIARVDFAYPELKVAIECDGAWHGERDQFAKDRRRLNRLVAAGWTVLHVTAEDLRRPGLLAARLRELCAQRATMINAR
jgi:hypothetical protein